MRLNLNVACRHFKGCRRTCRTCKLNGYACRFASPFVKDFSCRCRICGYSNSFTGFCRGFVFRAVHNNYFILCNRQIGCLTMKKRPRFRGVFIGFSPSYLSRFSASSKFVCTALNTSERRLPSTKQWLTVMFKSMTHLPFSSRYLSQHTLAHEEDS